MRAIDFHVHLPTPDWLDGSMAGYVEAAEAYFRSPVQRQSLGELADRYRALDVKAVLLAWDAETATGRPRVPNETVADACRAYPDAFIGIGSADPHKSSAAEEVARIADLGPRGVKFHPSLQAFAPDDPRYWPSVVAWTAARIFALVVFFRIAFSRDSLPDSIPYLTSMHPDAAILARSAGSTVSTRDRADQRSPRPLTWSQMSATLALLTMKLSSTMENPWMP